MNQRANWQKTNPAAFQGLMALERSLAESTLEKALKDLVKIRASQLNGCLLCLDMHSKEAKIHGERELRVYHLPVWRESALFTEKERAALEYTELLTRPGPHGVEDAVYEKLQAHFTEKEIVDLTLSIAGINAYNRLGIAFRTPAGAYDKMMGLDKAGLS